MRLFILFALLVSFDIAAAEGARQMLKYAPAPIDNPLKGLVPYAGDRRDPFPHSMEFSYIPISALALGYDQFDWKRLEDLINGITGRGHQAVFRVFLEYPGKKDVIPKFLINDGLKVNKYLNTNTQPLPPAEIETPDYADPNLRKLLKQFIAALGKKYDGDPRVGFITAGLLGTWGEWHDYPHDDLFASKEVQVEVMDAYEAAFKITPILVRYPAGEHGQKAANADRNLGYHDDSFAWATLETGLKGDSWFFMSSMKAAGQTALDKWKTRPIGGEIRPEAWGIVFDAQPGNAKVQDFRQCVAATHATWLMDTGLFRGEKNAERNSRAQEEVRRMGYEFHVPAVTITSAPNGKLQVAVELENRGVAPFYYDWPVEYGLLDASAKVATTFAGKGKLTGLLPGDAPRIWNEEFDISALTAGKYKLALRVPNPLPNGHPVRFANETQDADAAAWLTLGGYEQR